MLIKVKPWGKDQGDHVLIDDAEFDPKIHKKIEEDEKPKLKKELIKKFPRPH